MDSLWNSSLHVTPATLDFSQDYDSLARYKEIDYEAHSEEHKIISSAGILLLILISLLGNSLVCLAVYQSKHLQFNVNYFVVSLAISDMLVGLISMPIWMAFELTKFEKLPAGITSYSLIKGWTFVDILSGVASISNLVAISFERYWSIRSPLSHRLCMSNTYVVLNVLIVWIYSAIVASLYVSLWYWRWKVLFTAIIGFLVPLILIIFSYFNVYRVVQKVPANIVSREENHKVTRTVFILVIAFVICWLPFFIVSIVTIHCSSCHMFILNHQWLRSVVIWLHYFNSCCNPFLYCIFSAYYKDAFKIVLKKIFFKTNTKILKRKRRTSSRPISNITRSTADRSSSIHVPFLERPCSPDHKQILQMDRMPLADVSEFRGRTSSEPRYFTFNYKEYVARRDMARALSRSDSTEI